LDEFNKCRPNKDGLHRACKDCRREERVRCAGRIYIQKRRYYLAHKEELYRKNRVRVMANFEAEREYQRNYRQENRERVSEIQKKYRRRNGNKTSARSILNTAIKRGEVERLTWCQLCGRNVPQNAVEAHHADYSQPLSVVWMCKKHHHQIHVWLREEER
jgi:hypothetical protein